MFRLCLKSLPPIRYRRLLSNYLDLKNGFRYQNIFACKYRGYIYRFKSTKTGLFKSLSETVNKTKGREDVKLTDAKSQKYEEDKKLINKKLSDGHLNLGTDKSVVKTVRPAEVFYKNNERKYFQSELKNREIRKDLSPRKNQKNENNPLSNSEDLFTNFQELLTLPQKNLFKYESKSNSKKNKQKEVKKSVKLKTSSKKNSKYKPQPLAKNKKDPKIYENLNLLKEPEPQCDFLDLQSGKKRILIGGMNDFSPNLSKSHIQHTRSMTSQADRGGGGIFSKKFPRKKIERLEKRLLLETPRIKAIKNRLSKMDRYWVIAAKKKRENKIPEAIMILRDRIRQQIEASKTFKYPVAMIDEPVKFAMAGDDGRGAGRGETGYVRRDDIPASRVLEKVKIMNRKLKDTPYIPPLIDKKKYEMKKSSGGKFYLKKMKKQKIEKVQDVKKVEEEKPVKLYSDKIREKIMKASEKYKQQVEGVQEQVQDPQISGSIEQNQVEEPAAQQPEIMNAVGASTEKPPEGIAEAPKIEEVVKEQPKEEIQLVQNVPEVPEIPKAKQKFPHYSHKIPIFTRSPHVWSIRPYAPPEEALTDVKPTMTLTSAMEGFNLNSDVQRIILKAKAKAMGVQVPEEEKKPPIQEPPKKSEVKKAEEKKKIEIVRKSTFFALKSKKKAKVKESIMSVDKTDSGILPEVVKRTRVPVRIPEHAIQNPPSTTDPNERIPTQEETARKIRKWFLYGWAGEDPKPIVEKKSNDVEINKTSGKESPEKIQPSDFSKEGKKDEGKVKRGGRSKEMVLEPDKRAKKIANPPSGFRTPRISDPRMPQRQEPPREYRKPERISDPPSEPTQISDPPKPQQKISDPPNPQQKISDPPKPQQKISDPPKPQQKISDSPKEEKAPQKISDPPREHKSPARISDPERKTPQSISEPPKTPEKISDPSSQQSTAEKISDPPSEPIVPQKISEPTGEDKTPQKIADPGEEKPPEKISDPPSQHRPSEKISDPPSESKPPQKLSHSPSELSTSEPATEHQQFHSHQISDPPSEPQTPQKLPDPIKKPQAPKISRSPSEPRKLQKTSSAETKPLQKILNSPRESKTQPRISGSATLPRTGKISPPPNEPKPQPKILQEEPKPSQKIGDPSVEQYRVWVPSDESFKKKVEEIAKSAEKPEPRNEAAILAKKLSAMRTDIKVKRRVEMNVRKETIQIPRKPEMRISKKPEKVVKAKVEPARKASVEMTKTKDMTRVEKKVQWKPETDLKKTKVGHVTEPARKTSVEVAKAKEVAKVEKNVQRKPEVNPMEAKVVHVVEPTRKASVEATKRREVIKDVQRKVEMNQVNDQNLPKVKIVHVVATSIPETPAEVAGIEKDAQRKAEMNQISDQNLPKEKVVQIAATGKPESAAEVAKLKEDVKPQLETKMEEAHVYAQDLGSVKVEQATDTKAEAAAMKAAEVAKSIEAIATAERMLKAKKIDQINMQNFGHKEAEDAKQKQEPLKVTMRIPSASELQAKAAENFTNFDIPKIEELIKPEEKDLPYPKPTLASPNPPKIDDIITSKPEIAKSVKKFSEVRNEEPEVLKGAINIKLKPLSEIESLTKAVSTKPGNFKKVEYVKGSPSSNRGIDELEKIISKKIETIPCAKPKLPPYYYTPYTSSTLEPEEELINKKNDKKDVK